MNAALRLPTIASAGEAQRSCRAEKGTGTHGPVPVLEHDATAATAAPAPVRSLAFYRKHTETLLRRYLYASMLVGRAPSILTEPLMRGWASSRPVETFEDCVIFVLDMEKCLARLSPLDRVLLTRIVIQEYSFAETALLLNKAERIIRYRFEEGIDRLTGILLEAGTLKMPRQMLSADDCGDDG